MKPNHDTERSLRDEPLFSARAKRPMFFLAALLLAASTGAGCAANHAFPHAGALDVPSLVSELEAQPKDEEALFDLTYFPMTHLNLQMFTNNDAGSNYPDGHAFFSIRSWLPLFMFVGGEAEFFDTEYANYERNEFTAILWGLWARNEMTVQTVQGERVHRSGKLLWLFDWEDSVEYREVEAQPSSPEVALRRRL